MKTRNITRQIVTFLLIYSIFIQSAAFASPKYSLPQGGKNPLAESVLSDWTKPLNNTASFVFGKSYAAVLSLPNGLNTITDFWRDIFSSNTDTPAPDTNSNEQNNDTQNFASVMPDNPSGSSTYAAISRHRPSLNGGTIQGSLRVFSGESYTFNSQFHLTGDLFTVGVPNVTVNSGASHGGIISDGGSSSPSGYGITFNSGAVLPGKIHIRADSFALPSDIPSSVPNPSGNRYVNINSPSDVNSIGNWSTLRSLNVSPSNLTINVPPGNYDTFSMNGNNIKLVFSAGTYNFSGSLNLNNASRVESNGKVTINIGQGWNVNNGSYLLGANTSSSDVKINVVGSSFTLDNGSEINALVRAVNANVNINNGIIRGQLIANYLNISNGQIIASTEAADTIPPTLTITSPANNSTTQATSTNVTGTVSDSSGISGVTVNNAAANYNASTGTWSFSNLNLNLGSNTITAKATDNAGNVSTQTITVIRQQPPDTIPPTVSISSPANNSTVSDSSITVSGTAADTGTGATGINRVVVNGQNAAYNSSTGQWTISGVSLNEGANTIQAVAYDNAAPQNSAQTSIVVTRRTPDTNPPTISISSPANNSETYESNIAVNGTAIDEGLNATGVQIVKVNNQNTSYNSTTHQWSLAGVPLAIGDNTITAIALDGATPPNQAQAVIHVIRKEIPPPTVSISSPANNSTTTAESVSVAGLATAFGAGDNQITQVTVNGAAASYDGASGTWILSGLPLTLGANTITAKAVDSGGRETTAQITVTRNPVNHPPVAVDDVYHINEATPEFNIKLSSKFSAKTFVSGSPFTSILGIAASPDGKLYVSDSTGAILDVNLSTKAVSTVTTLPYARPRSMVIGSGGVFGDDLIVSDLNSEPNSFCCNGQVLKINRSAGETTVLSDGNPTFPGLGDPFGLAFSSGDGFAAGLYVMDFQGNSPYPPTLFRIDNDGTRSTVVTNPSVWTTERAPLNIVFGTGNGFGNDLYISDSIGSSPAAIWRVDSQNNISSFVTGEPLRRPGDMKFGRGGIFGNDLYVLDNQLKSVFRISADGTISVFARDLPLPDGSLTTMDFAPDGQSLFIGVNDKIIQITPASVSIPAPGVLVNDTDPENSPLTATLVSNASNGTVVLNSDGSFEYTSNSNFSGSDGFTYRVSDGELNSNTATVNLNNIVNQSPSINAGADQNISLPNAANLNGIVGDDNLPTGNLSFAWTKVSGDGNVSFGNPNAAQSTAVFSAPGTYILRLTASDGELSISDDITVTVAPPAQPLVIDAGADQVTNISSNSAKNIFSMNIDGTNVTRLTFGNSNNIAQSFTSDGSKFLFISNRDGNSEIYSMNADGTNQQRLTFDYADDATANWSPDGNKIIFSNNRTGNYDVYIMNADGTGLQQITNTPENEWDARWQPQGLGINGSKIAFFRFPAFAFDYGDIWTMNIDGSDQTKLTDTFRPDENPFWSSDGQRIGFSSNRDGNREMYMMNADGSNQQRISNNPSNNWVDGWSTDGNLMIEASDQTGDFEVYLRKLSDFSQIRLTNNPAMDEYGRLSPDGEKVYFSSTRNGIYLSGSVINPGLPSSGQIAFNWTKTSGPGNVFFSNPQQQGTNATFDQPGTYVLTLTANNGFQTVSDNLTVQVLHAPANKPPVVNAGADREINFGQNINLRGAVGDDGIPYPVYITYQWEKVSGPGNVNFSAPNSLFTDVSFGSQGVYTLKLSSSDSQLTGSDTVTVTVGPENAPPIVEAGENKIVALPNKSFYFIQNNLAQFNQVAGNPSIGVDFDSIAPGTDITGQTYNGILFEKGNQPAPSAPLVIVRAADTFTPEGFSGVINRETNKLFPASGENVLSPGGAELAPGPDGLKENDDLKLTFDEPVAAAGFDILFQEYDFYSAVSITIYDPQGAVLYQNGNLPVSTGNGGGAPGGREFFGFVSTRSNIKTIVIDEFDGNAEYPDSNIGFSSLRVQKVLPNTFVSLNGSVTDDGLPIGGTLTSNWTLTSGTGTATFSDKKSPTSLVTFSEAGTYVLRLTANDGALEAFDEVTITAYNNGEAPENQAPTVNAGQDQTVTYPNPVNLFGFVTDDGLPTGSSVSVSWSKVSGSGNVSFTSQNSASTGASFSQPGTYVLRLTATDTDKTTFDEISITVLDSSATNQPPVVNAGSDASINLNQPLTLSGTATDDGLPTGSTLSVNWSKISGPGTVNFSNPSALQTTATFSTEGTYILRLTANDGQLTSSDDLIVTVNPSQANQPPVVNAGSDKTIKLNGNLVTNGSAESEPVNGGIPNWNISSGNSWARYLGGADATPFARFGNYVFSPGTASDAEIFQDVDVRAYADKIDAGTQNFTFQVYVRSAAEAVPDAGRILIEYRDRTNLSSIATLNTGEISSTLDWYLADDVRVPPVGTGFIRIHLIAARKSGLSNDVFFDGVSVKADGNGATTKLEGVVTDDNLPAGNTLQTTWTKVSGSGNVIFGNVNSAGSSASFETAGNYRLRLTANDGEFTSTDDVIITVGQANQPPVVNAGADATVNAYTNLNLNGTATDDGNDLRYRWVKISGPGNVSINNGRIANPVVSFSAAGTYVLGLIVEDGELESSDDITVTVNPAPANQPPTVDAGQNQTISLPDVVANLNGSASDDGQPNANLTINWSKTSGPGNVGFANPNSAQTNAVFSAVGTYILRLTVSDGQYIAYDETTVTVSPQNNPPNVNIGADQTVVISQGAALQTQVSDDGLPAGGSLSAQWTKVSGDGNVTFSNPTQTSTFADFSQTGTYVLRLTVSDSQDSASDDVTITVIPEQPALTVEILTPEDGASVTEPTVITGTVSDGNWKLEYSLADTDDLNNRRWTTVSNGTGAASGNLGTLDTTLLMNGLYDVRLITANQYGQTWSDIISLSVENNLKVGHFTVSFEDMNVPVAGIPMQVIRTYDSRDKRKGDFGYGWTLGIKNVRLEKNKVLGLGWYQTRSSTFIPSYCIEPTRAHIITVTMPDGTVEKFDAKTERHCQSAAPITETRLVFTPQPGTRGTLSAGDTTVYVAGSVPGEAQLISYGSTGILDRTQFKYTAKDGTEFIINQGASGLQSVTDTNGNTLTISASGLTHSSGQSVVFTRDNQGRITQITDPKGVSNVYTYSEGGDLISYKDRENTTTSFTYETAIPHHLKSIVDPLNRTPIRNEYDSSGRLLKHTDSNGEEIVYTHNVTARSETVTDRLGNSTVYEYDVRGNVLVKRDALNNQTAYSYDINDNLLTETNALGKTTTYTYDQFDNRTSATDALGNRTEMTYNGKGQVLTIKDARNNTTTNTYDTGGNLLTTTDADGNVTTNTYSAYTGQLTTTRDALNNVTAFEYLGSYVKKQTDAQGNETTFAYDQNGNRNAQTVKRTNAQGQIETITTSFEYDNLNRLIKTTQPDGSFTRTEYNELGQQKATIDQAGNRTEFEYDALGRLIKTVYADGRFEESTFDAEGRRLTSKDRAGRTTSYEYDALGRLKKTTYSDGSFTVTNYDAAGQVLSSTDARGNSTVFTYDNAGRRLTVKNALDQITAFAYDANGNQQSMTDAAGHTTSYVYDVLNRKTKTIFADNSFTETTFDALGRRIFEKDQAGKQTQFFYDSLGRLMKVKDALNQETVYGYNELGQQISQKDALNRETRFEYDKLGRRTKRILPLGQTETYSYSVQGNLQSKTDFNGKTTTFAYDNMRRLLSKTSDASLNQPAVSFTYNDSGQRATMTDASGVTNYVYDARNRLQSKAAPNGTLGYTYDDAGSIKTLRSNHANGVSVDYAYDELNRLSTVKDNRLAGNQTTNYTYDAVGNLQSYSYPNQVTTSYAYNNLNRLTTLTVSDAASNLASYQYTLGASGNRTQVVENNSRTINYAYDDLYRLTQETIANSSNNGQINYNYDAVGNRLQRTSSVGQVQNQSSSFDANDRTNSDTFDDNGNTKQSNGRQFNYDFENKLTSTLDGITIVYDGDGNRVSKTVNGVTTKYLVDTNNLTGYAQVVEEIVGGQITKQYTYGHDLISQKQGVIVSFYNYDGHGSVRNLSNSAGQITDAYDYDAFGTLINRTGVTDNNYLYAGEQFDADLGFYYNRARYLNVETGRFVSQDTFEGNEFEPITLHKYLYTGNNPVDNLDPSGNFFFGVEGALTEGLTRGVTYPIFTRVIAAVATSLLLAGAIVSPYAELNSGLAEARIRLKAKVEQDSKRENDDILFHYTSRQFAMEISAFGVILASGGFKGTRYTFPPGAYATDIPPWSPSYTQSQLSALFYGGNENRDVSWFVAIKKNDFIPINYPGIIGQFYRPTSSAGDTVPVQVITFGPNLMLR